MNNNQNINDLFLMIALYNSCLGLYNSSLNTTEEDNQKAIMDKLNKIDADLQKIKAAIHIE
jgi:hypothetical protein